MKTYSIFHLAFLLLIFSNTTFAQNENLILNLSDNENCLEIHTFVNQLTDESSLFLKVDAFNNSQILLELRESSNQYSYLEGKSIPCVYLTQMSNFFEKINDRKLNLYFTQKGKYFPKSYKVIRAYFVEFYSGQMSFAAKDFAFKYTYGTNTKANLANSPKSSKVLLQSNNRTDCFRKTSFRAESSKSIGAYTHLTINSRIGITALEEVSASLSGRSRNLKLAKIGDTDLDKYLELACEFGGKGDGTSAPSLTPPDEYDQSSFQTYNIVYDLDQRAYVHKKTRRKVNGFYEGIEYINGQKASNVETVIDRPKGNSQPVSYPEDYLPYEYTEVDQEPECDEVTTLTTHIVQSTETLASIGKLYGISPQYLMTWNGLQSSNDIYPCMRLSLKNPVVSYDQPARPPRIICSEQSNSTHHVVQQGETIYSIARRYNLRVSDMKAWNNLVKDELQVCWKLALQPTRVIKVRPTTPTEFNQIMASKGEEIPTSYDENAPIFHTVNTGESLYQIAKKYSTSVEALKRRNNLTSNLIQPNQRLLIAGGTTRLNPKGNDIPASYNASANIKLHTVQAKETLYGIAKKHNISVNDLKTINDLTSDNIYKGQVLRVPVRSIPQDYDITAASPCNEKNTATKHVVRKGETLASIARKYRLSATELRVWNALDVGETLPECFVLYIDIPKN